ncbi:hypothetical protein ACNI65_06560 [Roseateles sp. So40a]|uniref:hypothetical protein n=1 Tax=Roseateles sp. So40a TaxID=3400226 RepID=UPI003A8C87C3
MTEVPFKRNELLVSNEDGSVHRLLTFDLARDEAWLILVGKHARLALPYHAHYSELRTRFRLFALEQGDVAQKPSRLKLSAAEAQHADIAWTRIEPLINAPGIFLPSIRNQLLKQRSEDLKAQALDEAEARRQLTARAKTPDIEFPPLVTGTAKTLLKDLRSFWQGGQTQDALRGHFTNCAHGHAAGTALRGRRTKEDVRPFQRTQVDDENMRDVIETVYLKLNTDANLVDTRQALREKYYSYVDGNGRSYLKPEAEAPSYHQLYRFLHENYPMETVIRRRKGDKEFEQNHRSTEGSIQQKSHGVGHQYEFDATIVDVELVATKNRSLIVGKPTLYLIIDRESRMIVGWYLGFENPSYTPAMLAILSIGENKERLCAYLGIEYDPLDWPAHGILPLSFVADQGELVHKQARRITRSIRAMLTNVPGLRPEMKPLVECGFALLHRIIAPTTNGYAADAHNRARRALKNDKQSLILKELLSIIVKAIIVYNRTMQTDYPLNFQQVEDKVPPSPRELFRHGVQKRMGLLDIIDFDKVRSELLPQSDKTSISGDGLLFSRLYYGSDEVRRRGWLVEGRVKRKNLTVSYDYRLVDEVYVHAPGPSGERLALQLVGDSVKFQGMSFAEVARYFAEVDKLTAPSKQLKSQDTFEFNQHVAPINAYALKEMRKQAEGMSQNGRRKDLPEVRTEELRNERMETAKAFSANGGHAAAQMVESSDHEREQVPANLFPLSGTSRPDEAAPVGSNTADAAMDDAPVNSLVEQQPTDRSDASEQVMGLAETSLPSLVSSETSEESLPDDMPRTSNSEDDESPAEATPPGSDSQPLTLRERVAAIRRRQNTP